MAELSTAETTADACCASSEQQATCCEPSDKADCCGRDEGCGCDAGNATVQPTNVREQVRESASARHARRTAWI